MEALSIPKKKALVFLNFMFHIFSLEFYWIILLQIPGMDNQPNPAPKIPQEDLDEEIENQHGILIEEEIFNLEEIKRRLEMIKTLLSLLLLCLHFYSNAPSERD